MYLNKIIKNKCSIILRDELYQIRSNKGDEISFESANYRKVEEADGRLYYEYLVNEKMTII